MCDDGSMSLSEAKEWLLERIQEGVKCPCCTQFAKLYRRKINTQMAHSLIRLYLQARWEFVHLPTVLAPRKGNEEPKLRFWGLLEEEVVRREDGGRAGWWRVTDKGAEWVQGIITVPMYAHVFGNECLALTGDPVTVQDALGTKFSYRELMGGV